MASAIGVGGLGDLTIRYGYERFDIRVMIVSILVFNYFNAIFAISRRCYCTKTFTL